MSDVLFKPFHIWPIITTNPAIRKTVTRRLWDKKKPPSQRHARAKVGAIHVAHLGFFGEHPFASLRILDVRQERLFDITEADALREGGYTVEEFFAVVEKVNKRPIDMDEYLFRVEFERLAGCPLTATELKFYEAEYWKHMAAVRHKVLEAR